MTKSEKSQEIEVLKDKINSANTFYIADSSELSVEAVNKLRGLCFDKGVELKVAKNTLVKKALEACDGEYDELYPILVGPTSLMFSEVANAPAKIIKEFRTKNKKEKPLLKAAFIDSSVYLGDDQVDTLAALKSKEELIADVLGLLQAPMNNLLSALKAPQNNLAGALKTLADRSE